MFMSHFLLGFKSVALVSCFFFMDHTSSSYRLVLLSDLISGSDYLAQLRSHFGGHVGGDLLDCFSAPGLSSWLAHVISLVGVIFVALVAQTEVFAKPAVGKWYKIINVWGT